MWRYAKAKSSDASVKPSQQWRSSEYAVSVTFHRQRDHVETNIARITMHTSHSSLVHSVKSYHYLMLHDSAGAGVLDYDMM